MRRTIGLVSAVGMLLVGTALTETASANHIACGTEITQDTTLHSDVGPCNDGHGLIVTGDNITLNLNGRRVFSDRPLPRMINNLPDDVIGIFLDDVSGVTVRNGTVHNFAAGVSIEGGGNNRVTGIVARDNQGPCIGEDFTTQAVGTYGDGIVVFASVNNRIEGNQTIRNGPFSGISLVANTFMINRIVGQRPTGNVVRANIVDDNRNCFADIGIRIEGPAATNNTVANNRVTRSFQEGIAVSSVNNINFSGLFTNPPTCQNRGMAGIPPQPFPNLPQCPAWTGADVTPSNDNNLISGNYVANGGFGGPQNPPRGDTQPTSVQTAAGIALISFCQGSQALGPFTINGRGNVIRNNWSTGNAGHGVYVGGCPPGDLPQFAPTAGYTDSQVLNNVAIGNNAAGCGVLPPAPGCGTRPVNQIFDLFDGSNVITCPATSATTQALCVPLGFGPPPAGNFVGSRAVVAGYPPCDNNTWRGNAYGTAFPPCTTAGGRRVGGGQSVAAAAAPAERGSRGRG
ncbi:MAG TPA: right-handed parallel beta-helix repeat-containing protein [Acidimicrobiales bacterium]|nr:right-handed parallel beta-helix repeat-containing protein [Acidimicrobiales bacterium]